MLETAEGHWPRSPAGAVAAGTLLVVRITSAVPDLPPAAVRRNLEGLPDVHDYTVHVKFLRYRDRPHLSAWTEFADRAITLQIPEPFLPFGEIVPYAAKRRPGMGRMRFIWLTEGLTFRTPREVLRFLYCHEWMHVAGTREFEGRRVGETACDRFALFNYQRDVVTVEDADRALRWRRAQDPASRSHSSTGS